MSDLSAERRHQANVNILEALKHVCLEQRVLARRMSWGDFRKTLVALFQEASDDELENFTIDVEATNDDNDED